MSVLGSPEDDPLLQNDPLSSSTSDDADADASPPKAEEDESASSSASASEPSSPEAPSTSEGTDSVFEAVPSMDDTDGGSHFHLDGEEDTRVVVRSQEELAAGRLTMLNSAFDQGWRLDRVECREPASSSKSEPSARSFAFILRRPT